MVKTKHLRGMLEDAWDVCPNDASTLRETLRNFERAARELISAGAISSISKNSASQTYQYGSTTFSSEAVAEHWRELIDLHDRVQAALTDKSDEAVYAEMMLQLVPVYGFTKDFSGLCCA